MNYKMKNDVVDLSELYRFREEFDLPRRGKDSEDSEDFKKYRKKYLELTGKVPSSPGWYIWYDSKNKEVIYVGQSRKLKERLNGELCREYHIFWMELPEDPKITEKMVKYYGKKYETKIERDSLKYRADRILWISVEGEEEITAGELDVVEMKLINKYQDQEPEWPKANTDKKDYRKIKLPLFEKVEELVEKHFKKV